MNLPENRFKRPIAASRQQIGLWCSLPSAFSSCRSRSKPSSTSSKLVLDVLNTFEGRVIEIHISQVHKREARRSTQRTIR